MHLPPEARHTRSGPTQAALRRSLRATRPLPTLLLGLLLGAGGSSGLGCRDQQHPMANMAGSGGIGARPPGSGGASAAGGVAGSGGQPGLGGSAPIAGAAGLGGGTGSVTPASELATQRGDEALRQVATVFFTQPTSLEPEEGP